MAKTKSAEKRNRQSAKQRERSRAHRSRMRGAVREVRAAVAAGDKARAQELLPDTLSMVDASVQKQVFHPNAAARTKSRLTRVVAGMKED